MTQTAVGMGSDEVRLLGLLFSLMTGLGYDERREYVPPPGGSIKYEKVLPVKGGTFRLTVYEVNSPAGSRATTFALTFDPVNKEGLVFGRFLEQAVVKLVAVSKGNVELRECVMEIVCKDPVSRLKSSRYYILNTNKTVGWSQKGKTWLAAEAQLTVGEALAVAEILANALGIQT